MALRRVQLVQIVQHEHEGLGRGGERRRKPRCRPAQDRDAPHVSHQIGVVRRDLRVRRCQRGQQRRGIVVEAVERQPRNRTILGPGPLGQQGRLAVARRRGHADDPAAAAARRVDERPPADRAGSHGAAPPAWRSEATARRGRAMRAAAAPRARASPYGTTRRRVRDVGVAGPVHAIGMTTSTTRPPTMAGERERPRDPERESDHDRCQDREPLRRCAERWDDPSAVLQSRPPTSPATTSTTRGRRS